MPWLCDMAKKIEELPVFAKATAFCAAVSEILERPAVRKNRKLWNQIADANDSILSNIREGFEQSSDDGFASFLVYSKGSTAEVISRLHGVQTRGHMTAKELSDREAMAEELGKMLGGFIKYLRRSGFKDRGSYKVGQTSASPPASKTCNSD
jgi:four helix bundle protein